MIGGRIHFGITIRDRTDPPRDRNVLGGVKGHNLNDESLPGSPALYLPAVGRRGELHNIGLPMDIVHTPPQ